MKVGEKIPRDAAAHLGPARLDALPTDVLTHLVDMLPISDAATLACASRTMARALQEPLQRRRLGLEARYLRPHVALADFSREVRSFHSKLDKCSWEIWEEAPAKPSVRGSCNVQTSFRRLVRLHQKYPNDARILHYLIQADDQTRGENKLQAAMRLVHLEPKSIDLRDYSTYVVPQVNFISRVAASFGCWWAHAGFVYRGVRGDYDGVDAWRQRGVPDEQLKRQQEGWLRHLGSGYIDTSRFLWGSVLQVAGHHVIASTFPSNDPRALAHRHAATKIVESLLPQGGDEELAARALHERFSGGDVDASGVPSP